MATCAVGWSVLAAATLLFNDVPTIRAEAPPGSWPPSAITKLLMLSVPLTGMTDLRVYVVAAGLALLLAARAMPARRPCVDDASAAARSGRRTAEAGVPGSRFVFRRTWLECLGAFVVGWALLSAWHNGTWELSRGWIGAIAVWIGWAAILSRTLTPRAVRYLFAGAAVIGVFSAALALWHRQALGPPFFELPIGPVTLTAALGAAWAAGALAYLTTVPAARTEKGEREKGRGKRTGIILASITAISGCILLLAAGRRGALAAFLAVCIGIIVVHGIVARVGGVPKKIGRRVAAGGLVLFGVIVSGIFIVPGARTAIFRATFPGARLDYSRIMLKTIPASPWFGVGPDMFVCSVTSQMAAIRAEAPPRATPRVDYDGHDEWLQAFFELGLPGGAAYLALPVVTIVLAMQRWRRDPATERSALLLSAAAALGVIVLSELFSINLRHPTLPAWFWTILGASAALLRDERAVPRSSPKSRSGSPPRLDLRELLVVRIGAAALAGVILYSVLQDVRRAASQEAGRLALRDDPQKAAAALETARARFGSRNWLWVRGDLGTAYLNRARTAAREAKESRDDADSDVARSAAAVWTELHRRCAAYPGAAVRLAESQALAGQRDAARRTLDDYLQRLYPYDAEANRLRLLLGGIEPVAALDCVRRAIRNGPLDTVLVGRALALFAAPEIRQRWPDAVQTAQRDLKRATVDEWADRLAPETLRLEALRLATSGTLADAASLQERIARAYADLNRAGSRGQRGPLAQADAWYLAARFLFDAHPGQYQQSFRMARRAVSQARRAAPSLPGGGPDRPYERIEGPGQKTPELRRLAAFTAMMHLANGADARLVDELVAWSLPPEEAPTAQRIAEEKAQMTADLTAKFQSLPAEQRPAWMNEWR